MHIGDTYTSQCTPLYDTTESLTMNDSEIWRFDGEKQARERFMYWRNKKRQKKRSSERKSRPQRIVSGKKLLPHHRIIVYDRPINSQPRRDSHYKLHDTQMPQKSFALVPKAQQTQRQELKQRAMFVDNNLQCRKPAPPTTATVDRSARNSFISTRHSPVLHFASYHKHKYQPNTLEIYLIFFLFARLKSPLQREGVGFGYKTRI
ncbi:hypothetical protein V9T40_014876 [Parthenolecanium corni]|uniref:Uncharacterized protein n=1 Tax=Parthenolecanium corni TaxID=536013 RepID=A0AAN9Y6C7_9HEMI